MDCGIWSAASSWRRTRTSECWAHNALARSANSAARDELSPARCRCVTVAVRVDAMCSGDSIRASISSAAANLSRAVSISRSDSSEPS